MEHEDQIDDDRHALSTAIRRLRRFAVLGESPTPEEIAEARASGILWVKTSWLDDVALVAHLAETDFNQFLGAVQLAWPVQSTVWLKVLRGQRFRVGVQGDSSLCDKVAAFNINALDGEDTTTTIPVRVVVNGVTPQTHLKWLHMHDSLERQVKHAAEPGSRLPRCWVTEVRVTATTNQCSSRSVLHPRRITTLGIPVYPLRLQNTVVSMEEAVHFMPSLHQLLVDNEHRDDEMETNKPVTVTSVHVDFDADHQTVESIFSAVYASPTMREIVVERKNPSASRCERLWQWLAVVFFTSHRSNAIHKLTLKACDLRMEDVREIRLFIQNSEPLYALFPRDQDSEDELLRGHVVSASDFQLARPGSLMSRETARVASFFAEAPVQNLSILDASSEWVSVLLPGWGQAWTSRSSAVLSPAQNKSSSLPDSSVLRPERDLTVTDLEEHDPRIICTFFHVIGRGLRKLTFTNCQLTDDELRTILRDCPFLEELRIWDANAEHLNVVAWSYRVRNCRAKRLVFRMQAPSDSNRVYQFFDRLADTSHAMAKCVRALRFEYHPPPGRHFLGLPKRLLQVLQENQMLSELYVDVRPLVHQNNRELVHQNNRGDRGEQAGGDLRPLDLAEGLQPFPRHPDSEIDALQAFDGMDTAGNLRILAKVAFLSVVHPVSTSVSIHIQRSTAMNMLDFHALSTIFEFAADIRQRFVHVYT